MPWPTISGHREGCVYSLCENSGHAMCFHFEDYYNRLCAAAQACATDPSETNRAALQAVLDENTGIIHD